MKLKVIAATTALLATMAISAGSVSALEIETGPDGESFVPIDPADNGRNDAHGPYCGNIEEDEGTACAHNNAPEDGPGQHPAGLKDRTYMDLNLGAWNAFFVSNENSAICGISPEVTGGC